MMTGLHCRADDASSGFAECHRRCFGEALERRTCQARHFRERVSPTAAMTTDKADKRDDALEPWRERFSGMGHRRLMAPAQVSGVCAFWESHDAARDRKDEVDLLAAVMA